jgi:hypothetical protein
VHTLVTLITAASLLLHTLVGCGSHGGHGHCTCHSHALGRASHTERHSTCQHDAHRTHAEFAHAEPAHDDHDSHPCRCHCEGNRCQAIPGSHVRGIEAPTLVDSFALPPLAQSTTDSLGQLIWVRGRDAACPGAALPLRAHLLYQSLLI